MVHMLAIVEPIWPMHQKLWKKGCGCIGISHSFSAANILLSNQITVIPIITVTHIKEDGNLYRDDDLQEGGFISWLLFLKASSEGHNIMF